MSADKLTARIIEDARAEAERIIASAKKEAARLAVDTAEKAEANAAELLEKARVNAAETVRRRMLTASLDARKNSLASRRRVLDSAFEGAAKRIAELSDADAGKLVVSAVLASDASGDEKVCFSKSDEKRFADIKLVDSLNAALKKAGRRGELSFGGASDRIASGALLVGEITDIDCSFESLLASFREEREQDVARELFGGAKDAVR